MMMRLLSALLLLLTSAVVAEPLTTLTGATMGTSYTVMANLPKGISEAGLQAQIDAELNRLNQLLSPFRQQSELSQFNGLAAGQVMAISPELRQVVAQSQRLYWLTGGALDVTLGPLIDLWGFGPQRLRHQAPSSRQRQQALAQTGANTFALTSAGLHKLHSDAYLNLSAVAKGYGVDRVAQLLQQRGIANYLVEIGGELRIAGRPEPAREWQVAVRRPVAESQLQQVIALGEGAIATSGDYLNFFMEDGQRRSHLIDPRDGLPVNHRLASVTVIAKQCAEADGLATAMMVLGTEASLQLAAEQGLAVMLIERQANGQFDVHYSDAFKPYLL